MSWINHATDHTHGDIRDFQTTLTPSGSSGTHPDLTQHEALGLSTVHAHPYAVTTHNHDAAYSGTLHNHTGVYEPTHSHPYAGSAHGHAIGDTTSLQTSLDGKAATVHAHAYSPVGHDHAGIYEADGSVATHAAAPDPHPGYLTPVEGNAVYSAIGHTHPGGSEAFPVGSLFLAVVSTGPATLLGYGVWVQVAQGRFLVGQDTSQAEYDTAEETGGAETHTHAAHTGVIDHTHPVTDPGHVHVENQNSATTGGLAGWGARDTSTNTSVATGYSTASATTGVTTQNPAGGIASLSHDSPNSVPPYFVAYIWKRTA